MRSSSSVSESPGGGGSWCAPEDVVEGWWDGVVPAAAVLAIVEDRVERRTVAVVLRLALVFGIAEDEESGLQE